MLGEWIELGGVLGVPLPWLYTEDEHLADMIRYFAVLETKQQEALLEQVRQTPQ